MIDVLLHRVLRPPLVLAYHGIGDVPSALDPSHLMVAPDRFRRQLDSLASRGYRFVKVSEFAAAIVGETAPAGCCALTFDDGTVDNAETLPAILAEFDAPASVFVCPDLLGEPHFSIAPDAGVRLMNAEELAELARDERFEIGSHTRRHTIMGTASPAEAFEEMSESKRDLEALIGRSVTSFAYPACQYSAACPEAARRAGYEVAVTCAPAGGWRPFELRRESIDGLDGRFTFALKARGAWEPLYASAPGRLARRIVNSRRHRGLGA